MQDLIVLRPQGLYCPPGDFFIDPWRPVSRAILTHGHSDHARGGHGQVICSERGLAVLRRRLGDHQPLLGLPYGESIQINGLQVSLHPASHVLGASQIRIASSSHVWVVSGDYRVEVDQSCDAFEPVRSDVFVTETTFGMPIYQWRPQRFVMHEMIGWWKKQAHEGRACLVYTYALGKAQRVIMALKQLGILSGQADRLSGTSDGPGAVYVHEAVAKMNQAYRESGIDLPCLSLPPPQLRAADLVLAPQSVQGSKWLGRQAVSVAQANVSGWMSIRGVRRRYPGIRGFVLSDHADWPGLLWAIQQSRAERVILTHGYTAFMSRWLTDLGLQADVFQTEFDAQMADV